MTDELRDIKEMLDAIPAKCPHGATVRDDCPDCATPAVSGTGTTASMNTEEMGENPVYTEFKAWWTSRGADGRGRARHHAATAGGHAMSDTPQTAPTRAQVDNRLRDIGKAIANGDSLAFQRGSDGVDLCLDALYAKLAELEASLATAQRERDALWAELRAKAWVLCGMCGRTYNTHDIGASERHGIAAQCDAALLVDKGGSA
jgi:hypothetical protein